MFRTKQQKARRLRLQFREPVTPDLLMRVCTASGVDLKDLSLKELYAHYRATTKGFNA